MNYKKIYDSIIENRIKNPVNENEYYEKHHIVPKSLGGSNKKTNIIKLTAREHFICHLLLSEIYPKHSVEWIKMNTAFMMMKATSKKHELRYINNRLYNLKRLDFSKAQSLKVQGDKNPRYGKPRTQVEKDNIQKSVNKFLKEKGVILKEEKIKESQKRKKEHTVIYNNKQLSIQTINKLNVLFNIDIVKDKEGLEKIKSTLEQLWNKNNCYSCIARELNSNYQTVINYLKFFKITS